VLQSYCGDRLRRCAVLGILTYSKYVPVPARRTPGSWPSSLRFSTPC